MIKDWFSEPGAYVLVDGQYGSTGKGLLASFIAEMCGYRINKITTNAGPNSGHTAYFGDEPFVTRQLPVAAVYLWKQGDRPNVLLNAGAVIDGAVLNKEIEEWAPRENGAVPHVWLHPNAVVITHTDKAAEGATVQHISSTGKGVGAAIARKVMRSGSISSVAPTAGSFDCLWDWTKDRVLVETAQGYSLGINRRFYPYCTSRECTVMQAIADASIPAQMVRKVVASYRTYPIRVGSVANSTSGGHYPDQRELAWEDIGVRPEYTTVTKRERRVFSWSRIQFRESVAANRPDVIFLNFCNYITVQQLDSLTAWIFDDYREMMGREPEEVLYGFGPKWTAIKSGKGYV